MNVRRMNKSKSQCPYLLPSREKALIPRNRYWAALGFLPRLPISRDFRFPQANDGICHQSRIVQLLSLKIVGKLHSWKRRKVGALVRLDDSEMPAHPYAGGPETHDQRTPRANFPSIRLRSWSP